MISIPKDSLNLLVKYGYSQAILTLKRIDRTHIAFRPNQQFWDIWHSNKQYLRDRGLSVEKKGKRQYEVFISRKWYEFHLTPLARRKYNVLSNVLLPLSLKYGYSQAILTLKRIDRAHIAFLPNQQLK